MPKRIGAIYLSLHGDHQCLYRAQSDKLFPGTHIAEATVTGPVYLDMLERFLELQLLTADILDTVVFQQDGAPCHYAIIVRDYLDRRFPGRWIGHGGTQPWAARSPI